MPQLTAASLALFTELVRDSGNWSGEPLIDITREERGNLTQLKRAGLLETFTDEGCVFAIFTDDGREFARSIGLEVRS